jgi:hypothetical protein
MSLFEKKFKVIRRKGRLFLDYEGWTYDLSPPEIINMTLPPDVSGVDAYLLEGSKNKGIKGDFSVSFNSEWFIGCDASAKYMDKFMDGWIYEIRYSKNVRRAWICPYLKFLFDKPPEIMHVLIEP